MQDVESPLICLSTTATLHILKTSMLWLTVSIQKHAATLNFSLKIAFYLTLNLNLKPKKPPYYTLQSKLDSMAGITAFENGVGRAAAPPVRLEKKQAYL